MFFQLVLSGWLLMTAWVSWRASSVPFVARRLPRWLLVAIVALLGISYVLARSVRQAGWPVAATVLEVVGATWMGTLFLLFVTMLAVDLVTGFGFFFRRHAARIRASALVAGAALAAIALVQGHRPPVVREYAIELPGLPPARDDATLVFISDLHLGTLVGEPWFSARIAQISALRPDAIVIGGDVLEGDDESERALLSAFGRLSAPLGVWAVAGNHERHGGGAAVSGLEANGVRMLRNQWKEIAPGLILAGVEATRGHAESGTSGGQVETALAGRPPGTATILVSHVPERMEAAALAGAGLMLSAHTHGGQIWPFGYVVGLAYPHIAGSYDVAGMPLLVCRGTGTFGPRMRLWRRSEILRITLRRPRA